MANDDGIVRIGTEVDVSTLKSGMDQAASAVRSSAQSMASAMAEATAASNRFAEAQAQLGAAAEAGNAQAAAVLAEYQTELMAAQAAVEALASSETQETAIVRTSISARMAASSELRVLEGNLMGSTRAAGAFLSTLPGLGTAMQMAFPIFGAVALVEILGRAAQRVYELYEQYISLDSAAKQFQDTVTQLRDKNMIDVESIEDANLRVQHLNTSARDLLDAAQKLHAVSLAGILPGLAANGGPGAATAIGGLLAAREAASEGYKQKLLANTIDLKTIELNHQIANAQIEAAHAGDAALAPLQRINAEEQKRLALIREEQQYKKSRDQALGNPIANNSGSQLAGIQEQAAQGEAAAQRVKLAQEEVTKQAREQQKVYDETAKGAIAELRQSTEALERDTNAAMDNMTASTENYYKSIQDDSREEDRAAKAAAQAYKEKAEMLQRVAEAQNSSAQQAEQEQLAEIAKQQSMGLSHLRADQERAAAVAEFYQQKLEKLKSELAQLVPFTEEYSRAQKELTTTQGQFNLSQIQNQGKINQDIAQPWLNAFNQINSSWLQVQNQMFYTTRNIGQQFAKMGQQIFISIVDNLEKAALIAAERELMMVIMHQAANNTKVASDAQAAAQSNSISAVSSLKEVTHAAATAAAKAYSAMAGIPIVGPILGAVAAGTVFAAVEAFGAMASFDTGTGYVPNDGIAMLHQGEAVIPAPTMEDLRGSGGGGDGNISIEHTTNINAATDRAIVAAIRRNPREIATAMQRHLRQQGKTAR